MLLLPASYGIGGPGSFTTLSLDSSATSGGSATITIPAGASAGNFAVLFDCGYSGSTTPPTNVVPSGWTQLTTREGYASFKQRFTVSYRFLTSGDPGSSVTGMDEFGEAKVRRVGAGDVNPTTVSSIQSENWEFVSDDPASQTVTSGSGTAPLIVFGVASGLSYAGVNSDDLSPAGDGSVEADSGNIDLKVVYKIYNSSPVNMTWDKGNDGSLNEGAMSFYLELS